MSWQINSLFFILGIYSLVSCFASDFSATCETIETSIQRCNQLINETQQERVNHYKLLCHTIVAYIIEQLQKQSITPEQAPAPRTLVGSLLAADTYAIDIIPHEQKPSLMAESSWKQRLRETLIPHVSVQLPHPAKTCNFFFSYFTSQELLPLLAHEIAHLWKFDSLKRDEYDQTLYYYATPLALAYVGSTHKLYTSSISEHTPRVWWGVLFSTLCLATHHLLAQRGLFRQQQEFDADAYVMHMGSGAIKSMISLLARWHIGIELSMQHERAKRHFAIARFLWQTRTNIKTWFLEKYQNHPNPLARIVKLLAMWQQVRMQELLATDVTREEAQIQAIQEINEQYRTVIQELPELTREYCLLACAQTLQWRINSEEQEHYLLPALASIKTKLLSLGSIASAT